MEQLENRMCVDAEWNLSDFNFDKYDEEINYELDRELEEYKNG